MVFYISRTYEEQRTIQRLWKAGIQVKEIADKLDAPLSSIYSELPRSRDGSRLPNQRLCSSADLAQLRIQQSFERRGRRAGKKRTKNGNFEKITATPEALGAFLASLNARESFAGVYPCSIRLQEKKTTRYQEQDPQQAAAYQESIKDISPEKITYVDESGIDTYLYTCVLSAQAQYHKLRFKFQTNRCAFPCGTASAPVRCPPCDEPKATPGEYDIPDARSTFPTGHGPCASPGGGSPMASTATTPSNNFRSCSNRWRYADWQENFLSGKEKTRRNPDGFQGFLTPVSEESLNNMLPEDGSEKEMRFLWYIGDI